jgi:hypothetical protein
MTNPNGLSESNQIKVCSIPRAKCYYLPVTTEQLSRWKRGELIQSAMPHLSNADRELLISGVCGICWLALFGASQETEF